MRKNLLLRGPIGCGKSTMIQNALGEDVFRAGGYVTLRVLEQEKLLGFTLSPAAAWQDPSLEGQRFLDFTGPVRRDPKVFSGFGKELLTGALDAPFAVADEFGGLELMVPEFRQTLLKLLQSPVPCIGVFKSADASESLIERLHPEDSYRNIYGSLTELLEQDDNTEILDTTGRYDETARIRVEAWVSQYVRK